MNVILEKLKKLLKKFSFSEKHIKFAGAIKEVASASAENNNLKSTVMEKQTIHFNPPLGGHLLEDININSNTNNAENEETSRQTATHLNAHANTKNNNLNNKHMEGNILFYFTDESTLAAPKGDLRITFTKNPHDIVDIENLLELKQLNVIVVKLNKPITVKEINSWLNQFRKVLREKGIGSNQALPAPHSINAKVCKNRIHADGTIDTIRYAMHIYF